MGGHRPLILLTTLMEGILSTHRTKSFCKERCTFFKKVAVTLGWFLLEDQVSRQRLEIHDEKVQIAWEYLLIWEFLLLMVLFRRHSRRTVGGCWKLNVPLVGVVVRVFVHPTMSVGRSSVWTLSSKWTTILSMYP